MVAVSGIVGLVTFDGARVDPASVEAMADAAPHRGLDGAEAWAASGAALSYQRRRVLAGGADEHGLAEADGIVCVADARLDNRPELLAALSRQYGVHATSGEAEIVLAAYREWGTACAGRLIGDFAFVVWDGPRRTLLAARDPMAMRSLAFHVLPGRSVAFATEVKQLLALPHVPVRINERAVAADLLATFGHPAWSFFDGIESLPPGHVLVADRSGHRTERFWAPDPDFRLELRSEADYADALRDRFVEAVGARLRTDRPAGILMSGGVDSGSAGAAAAWLIARGGARAPSLHAFSWAFERFAECDERAISRLITDAYGIDTIDVDGDELGPLAQYPAHGPDRDDPYLGGFQPLIERSLRSARDTGVGMLLGGDRGDLLVGNSGWSFLRLAQARRWTELRTELAEYRRSTTDTWWTIAQDQFLRGVIGRLRGRSASDWARRLLGRARSSRVGNVPDWVRPTLALEAAAQSGDLDLPSGFGPARRTRAELIFTQLHVRGMAWSERSYARHGLTFADPFSDRRMVEFALAVPPVIINRPGDASKPLMRDAMRGLMPNEARRRLDKVIPLRIFEEHLREDAATTVIQLLTDSRVDARGWVDGAAWRAHYDAWRAGRAPLAAEWWWTLGVEIWLRQHWE